MMHGTINIKSDHYFLAFLGTRTELKKQLINALVKVTSFVTYKKIFNVYCSMRSSVPILSSIKSKSKRFNVLKNIIGKKEYIRKIIKKGGGGEIGNKFSPGHVLFRILSPKLREEWPS